MDNELQNVLVILGNGFDIQAGLNSTYSNFFQQLEQQQEILKKIQSNYFKFPQENFRNVFDSISIWPFIFKINNLIDNETNWMNVELGIYNFLNSTGDKNSYNIDVFSKHLEIIIKGPHSCVKHLNSITDNVIRNQFQLSNRIFHYFNSFRMNNTPLRTFNEIELNNIFLSQLVKFEALFSSFMSYEYKSLPTYSSNSNRLLKAIINLEKEEYNHLNILNFNYTTLDNIDGFIHSQRNIHDTIEQHGIFGIDSSSINSSNNFYNFTKTYRVMHKNMKTKPTHHNDLLNNLKYIYFYGHSLGQQDHSYFQSIFDSINLYSGKTILRFVYTPYFDDHDDNWEYEKLFAISVSNLIELYGESFEQEKIKGKNLLHRLLLENRIEIIKLPNKSYL